MRLLVVGGTVFTGRAVVSAALARGHDVTVFHRGRHGEDAVPAGVAHVHGDRRHDAEVLAGTTWDAVVDTCAFTAEDVTALSAVLRGRVGHYGLVSSVSVYPGWPAVPVGDASPVYAADAPPGYGEDKARAERAAVAAYGADAVLVARPGLVVGPHENIGRLPFWLRRVARGGEVPVPGAPDERRQWVDARDFAEWLVASAERGYAGTHAVVSPEVFTMGELMEHCRSVTGSSARFRWVAGPDVAAAGVAPWTELPIWMWDATEPTGGTWAVDPSGAVAAGFSARPVAATVADTWTWLRDGGELSGYRAELAVRELEPERERLLLGS